MNNFAAAGLIAVAAATSTGATPTPHDIVSTLDFSRFYDYGHGVYEYPSFDHKEELTPVKTHPTKKHRGFKTHNIDIFAHSSSDEEKHHPKGHGTSSDHSSTSQSDSDTSADEKKHRKKHTIILTGEGPYADHCHSSEGDYCGKKDSSSDDSSSDYSLASEESHDQIIKIVGCQGGERCARVDFDWNLFGIDGTLDIFQPGYTAEPTLLFDADFDGLERWTKYEMAIRTLPVATAAEAKKRYEDEYRYRVTDSGTPTPGSYAAHNFGGNLQVADTLTTGSTGYIPRTLNDRCDNNGLGTTFEWLGSSKTDRNGDLNMRVFNDDVCMEDIIGRSVELRGKYGDFQNQLAKTQSAGALTTAFTAG